MKYIKINNSLIIHTSQHYITQGPHKVNQDTTPQTQTQNQTNQSQTQQNLTLTDLAKSNLTTETFNTYPPTPNQLKLCKCPLDDPPPSYVIPYTTLQNQPLKTPFFRLKLLKPRGKAKYIQPANSPNHVYFPKGFHLTFESPSLQPFTSHLPKYLIITEGEKKSQLATLLGFPCVGLGGVDSWRNRRFTLQINKIQAKQNQKTKQDDEGEVTEVEVTLAKNPPPAELSSMSAIGLASLIELAQEHDAYIIILFDSDLPTSPFIRKEVQLAAANLLTHLVMYMDQNFDKIRLVKLPPPKGASNGKIGLDDFLNHDPNAPKQLAHLIEKAIDSPRCIPTHPNMKTLVNKMLNTSIQRSEIARLSLNVIAQLDSQGYRIKTPEYDKYYFDGTTKMLYPVSFKNSSNKSFSDSPFGIYLHDNYGITSADSKLLKFIEPMYTTAGALNVKEAQPAAGLKPYKDGIDIQAGPSHILRIQPDHISVHTNGEGTLFRSDAVTDLDLPTLTKAIQEQQHSLDTLEPWWYDVIKGMSIKELPGLTVEQAEAYITTLFYVSPWLNRWRGAQMPFEMWAAQPASGKTGLMQLRAFILSGRSETNSINEDIRDWRASITAAPGIWCGDNVSGKLTASIKNAIADELCRLVTDEEPGFTVREMYTTNSKTRIPIHTTFAVTAVMQPFQQPDLVQRSVVINLDPISAGQRISNWTRMQLEKRGSREEWLAHHAMVLLKFFRYIKEKWSPTYMSIHRLSHFEQCMVLMSEVLGFKEVLPRVALKEHFGNPVGELDTTLEALKQFAEEFLDTNGEEPFLITDIVTWIYQQPEYVDDEYLTNPRKLGRYIKNHSSTVRLTTGIKPTSKKRNNRLLYIIKPVK